MTLRDYTECRQGDPLILTTDYISNDRSTYVRKGTPCLAMRKNQRMIKVNIKTPLVGMQVYIPYGHLELTNKRLRTYLPKKEMSLYWLDRAKKRTVVQEINNVIKHQSLVEIHYWRHETDGGDNIIRCRILDVVDSIHGGECIRVRAAGEDPTLIQLTSIYEIRVSVKKFKPKEGFQDGTV